MEKRDKKTVINKKTKPNLKKEYDNGNDKNKSNKHKKDFNVLSKSRSLSTSSVSALSHDLTPKSSFENNAIENKGLFNTLSQTHLPSLSDSEKETKRISSVGSNQSLDISDDVFLQAARCDLVASAQRLKKELQHFDKELISYHECVKSSIERKKFEKSEENNVTTYDYSDNENEIKVENTIYMILSVDLCKVTKKVIPNVQRKIDEIIEADNRDGMEVNKEEHGADLKDLYGNLFELKVSTCAKKKGYECNFIWPVPAGKTIDERRCLLLEKVKQKTGGNGEKNMSCIKNMKILADTDTLKHNEQNNNNTNEIKKSEPEHFKYEGGGFIIKCNDIKGQKLLNEYFLSGFFMYHYFKRLRKFPTSINYNLGCKRCPVCLEYHRLKKLQDSDVKLLSTMSNYFLAQSLMDPTSPFLLSEEEQDEIVDNALDWKELFTTRIKSKCSGNNK